MKTDKLVYIFLISYCCVYAHGANDATSPLDDDELDQFFVGKELKSLPSVHFLETFNIDEDFNRTWVVAKATKENEEGPTSLFDGDWVLDKAVKDSLPNDNGLTFKMKAKYRAISSKLLKDFVFSSQPFILQYEVLFQDGQECGGAYLKLVSKERPFTSLYKFNDKTPYTIMFGPDKCGTTSMVHFIFRHYNPVLNFYDEKHCKQAKTRIDEVFTDGKPHLFKLKINPDNTFSISVDHKVINEGSLLEDFEPPVNPPREIDDPNDKKPTEWDDREKIPDPTANKPDDWDEDALPEIPDVNAVKPAGWFEDEPINISDPRAEKPDDWDDDMDGEWEAPLVPNPACEDAPGCGPWSPPLISNPEYKGKWSPPLIENPNFAGIWKPRRIPNPHYFEDKNPFLAMSTIDSLGFELWSMSANIVFDNIILTNDDTVANQFGAATFDIKLANLEKSADTMFNQFVAFTNRYPWLWALYVVILLIPITLIVICCFWTSKDPDAEHKKDDDLPTEHAKNPQIDETSSGPSSRSERESTPHESGDEKKPLISSSSGSGRNSVEKDRSSVPKDDTGSDAGDQNTNSEDSDLLFDSDAAKNDEEALESASIDDKNEPEKLKSTLKKRN